MSNALVVRDEMSRLNEHMGDKEMPGTPEPPSQATQPFAGQPAQPLTGQAAQGGHPPQGPPPPTGPQRKKNFFARHKFLTTLLIIAVIVIIASIASSGGGEEPPGDSKPAPTSPTGSDEAPGIGAAANDGQFQFTVTKMETGIESVGSAYLGEKAQGQFVILHMTVKNTGDEAQYFSESEQVLTDAQGRKHKTDSAASLYYEDKNDLALGEEINPGNEVSGVLIYDIPKDAKPVSVELHDSAFSDGVTVTLK